MLDWITKNMIEIIGTLSGFVFLYFEIKQSKWLWPVGLFSAVMYIYVFFMAKFYADMGLQFYYVFISVYGWFHWSISKSKSKKGLPITRLNLSILTRLILVSLVVYVAISFVLVNYTDSPLPYWDAFTTSLSIVATWMLAKKILEQWLVWVLVDAVSMGLYLYKELYPTTILFGVYTLLAVYGYIQWKKDMLKTEAIESI